MTEVDIVVPCFNAARTLRATIDSALAQDAVASITVVDDGSTDDSLAVARSLGARVRVLTGPNRGVAPARNRGAASGDAQWLLFLDSDDVLTASTVSRRLAAAAQADVVVSDWEDFVDPPSDASPTFRRLDWDALQGDAERAIATDVWAPPAALLYRRALFARSGGFRGDVSPIEDARMMFDAARLGARFAHSAHVGARYRIVAQSFSRGNPARFWRSVLRNGQQIEALWRAEDRLDPERRRVIAGIYDNAARGLLRAAHPDCRDALAAARRLGGPRSRHGRIAGPLVSLVGVATAQRLLHWVGRA